MNAAALGDILAVRKDADPAEQAEIYGQIGQRLTYQPGQPASTIGYGSQFPPVEGCSIFPSSP